MQVSVLILGGTAEARQMAEHLAKDHPRWRIVTSLAGRTTHPRRLSGDVRIGGFGGAEGLINYLKAEHVRVVIDATHPYAAQISAHASAAAAETHMPLLRLERAPWLPQAGDDWTLVTDIEAATHEIARTGKTCLITTGVNDLAAYKNVHETKLIVRLIEPLKDPMSGADMEVMIGKPPYTVDDEKALFQLLGIDVLVSKNAGGSATRAKIDAARALGIPVIMIDRPALPPADNVATVDQARAWLERQFT